MKAVRWKKIETLCQEAMGLRGEDRISFLKNSCVNDPDLFEEVKSLLEQEDASWLEEPLVQMQTSYIFSEDHSVTDHTIGPYRLIRPIARGGMGQVYLAVRNDDQFDRFVALKVIRNEGLSVELLNRFYEERQILARLNHSNIARLFDGGTTGEGRPWFAMEYVEGTPINEYCKRNRLSVKERLNLFQTVCSAVQYAHQNLIVHHDLKPANILITETGDPKLLDFGIASLMDLDQPSVPEVEAANLLTPEYAAPEQVMNQPISTTNDIYSMGVILYELLAGRLPYSFKEKSPECIRKTVCEEIPAPPSEVPGSKVSKSDLDDVVLKALKKNPAERYSSVEQLAEDIRRHNNSLPVVAHKNSLPYRSKKFLHRHAWSTAAAAVTALLLLVFASITYLQSMEIEDRAVEAENERDRAEQVSGFLIDLFESVDPSEARDHSLSAVDLLNRGADRVETELVDQPGMQAELYLVISDVYESLGLYDSGIEMAGRALRLFRDQHGEMHPDVASGLNALGWLYRQKGDYDRADSLLQSALKMRRELFDDMNLDVARSLNDLAVLKQSRGEYEVTDSLLKQALEIRRSKLGDTHETVGVALSNYAALKWRMNELEPATEMMRESLQILKENHGREDMRVAIAMTNLAALLLSQGITVETEALYREALDIRYQLVGEEHPDVAYSLVHLGNLLRAKGEYEEAEELFLKALEMRKKLLGQDHELVGDTHRLLGYLFESKGENSAAVENFKAAIELFESIFPDGHARTAQVLDNLGELYLEMNQPAEAEPLFREAISIRTKVYGENDSRTAASMIKFGISQYENGQLSESRSLLTLGIEILNNLGNAEDELMSRAENILAVL